MEMFKQRLIEFIGIILIAAVFIGAGFGVIWLAGTYEPIGIIIGFSILLIYALAILYGIYRFIKWLFIEPILESNWYWQIEGFVLGTIKLFKKKKG